MLLYIIELLAPIIHTRANASVELSATKFLSARSLLSGLPRLPWEWVLLPCLLLMIINANDCKFLCHLLHTWYLFSQISHHLQFRPLRISCGWMTFICARRLFESGPVNFAPFRYKHCKNCSVQCNTLAVNQQCNIMIWLLMLKLSTVSHYKVTKMPSMSMSL